jgi:hypothetical protein
MTWRAISGRPYRRRCPSPRRAPGPAPLRPELCSGFTFTCVALEYQAGRTGHKSAPMFRCQLLHLSVFGARVSSWARPSSSTTSAMVALAVTDEFHPLGAGPNYVRNTVWCVPCYRCVKLCTGTQVLCYLYPPPAPRTPSAPAPPLPPALPPPVGSGPQRLAVELQGTSVVSCECESLPSTPPITVAITVFTKQLFRGKGRHRIDKHTLVGTRKPPQWITQNAWSTGDRMETPGRGRRQRLRIFGAARDRR